MHTCCIFPASGYDAGTDGKGRLTGASDANHSMTWAYDAQGRVTSKGQTLGTVTKTAGYAYTNGNLTTLTTPSGQSVVYANGRVAAITINGTTLLSNVTYEPFGPVRGWAWGNATSMTRLHDTDGNASQISGAELTSYGYDDAACRRRPCNDPWQCPDAISLEGLFLTGAAGISFDAIPNPNNPRIGTGLPGLGGSVSYTQMGDAISIGWPPGYTVGRDKSVSATLGSATVTSSKVTSCCGK